MIEFVHLITLITGLILLVVAGYQDYTTHKPTIIMPAMILIGLSQSIIIGVIIFMFAAISLFFLPNSVNKVFGKADIFFLASALVLIIINSSIFINTLVIIASITALGLTFYYIYKKPTELMPWVGFYATGVLIAILLSPLVMGL